MVVCSNNVYEVVSNLANYFEHTIYLCMVFKRINDKFSYA
ncbi:hypothetical protein M2273_005728 [Mucilaginibacter lappiensis]|jgi:hypothetical protein